MTEVNLLALIVHQVDTLFLNRPAPCSQQQRLDAHFAGTIEHRGRHLDTQRLGGPPEVGFQNLTNVHARRHAQRIQHDVDRRSVGEERHLLHRHDTRHNTLVAVATGHLVAYLQLALCGHEHLADLDHAGRQFVARLDPVDLVACVVINSRQFLHVLLIRPLHAISHSAIHRQHARAQAALHVIQGRLRDLLLGLQFNVTVFKVDDRLVDVRQQFHELRVKRLVELTALLGLLRFNLGNPGLVFLLGLHATLFAAEDLHIHHNALRSGGNLQACVAHIVGLFAKDGPQQLVLGALLGFAAGRHLAHQDVVVLHLAADHDEAVFIQLGQHLLVHVGDVAGNVFLAQLRIAGINGMLFNVDRRQNVFRHHTLADQDGILEVVTTERHERGQQVCTQCQLAIAHGRTIGQHVALGNLLAFLHQRTLIHARVLIRTTILHQRLHINHVLVRRTANGHFRGRCTLHQAIKGRQQTGARVQRCTPLHAGAHDGGIGKDQRNSLALHVRTHQRTVGVVMLQEGNQGRTHRHQLVRRNVHVTHFLRLHLGEIVQNTRQHHVHGDAVVLIHRRVRLRDDVLILFVGSHVLNIIGHDAICHATIGRLDEAKIVNLRVS